MISGRTKVYGLIGWPVEASLSPAMHNSAFQHIGYDGVYVVFPVRRPAFSAAFRGAVALGVSGLNITAPFKECAVELCDSLDGSAFDVGAVNTVCIKDGRAIGYNTDGSGFLAALSSLPFSPAGGSAVILGAGGAARAVAVALARRGLAGLAIINRDVRRAGRLAEWMHERRGGVEIAVHEWDSPGLKAVFAHAGLVVQATPARDIPFCGYLRSSHVVVDLITADTPFLVAARERGCACQDGREMLLFQGSEAFTIWTGRPAPLEKMRKHLGK